MKYKVVCEICFPQFETTVDVNIPYNKTVFYVCKMLEKLIVESISPSYQPNPNSCLINQKNGMPYDMNALISETDIKNGTRMTYY